MHIVTSYLVLFNSFLHCDLAKFVSYFVVYCRVSYTRIMISAYVDAISGHLSVSETSQNS